MHYLLFLTICLPPNVKPVEPTVTPLGYGVHVHSPLYDSVVSRDARCVLSLSYALRSTDFGDGTAPSRSFKTLSPDTTLERRDFRGCGGHVGHIRPLASSDKSPHWRDVNKMENTVFMTVELNTGPWLRCEDHTRRMATKHGSVYITVIPDFTETMPPLPNADETHVIPAHIWLVMHYGDTVERYRFSQRCNRTDPLQLFRVLP